MWPVQSHARLEVLLVPCMLGCGSPPKRTLSPQPAQCREPVQHAGAVLVIREPPVMLVLLCLSELLSHRRLMLVQERAAAKENVARLERENKFLMEQRDLLFRQLESGFGLTI